MDLPGVIPALFPRAAPRRARGLRPCYGAVSGHTTHPTRTGIQLVLGREGGNHPGKHFCLSIWAIHLVVLSSAKSFSYCTGRRGLATAAL